MRVIAVANQKGGVGKTTSAVNIAACLGELGRRVLLIDLDPQGNASTWLGVQDEAGAVWRIIVGQEPIGPYILGTGLQGVSIVPSSKTTAAVDSDLAEHGSDDRTRPAERLGEGLQAVRTSDEFDVVIIDTPPSLGFLSSNGIHAADDLIVPVEAHVMAAAAIARLLESVQKWGLSPAVHIVPVRVDRRNRHTGDVVDRLRELYPDAVTDTVVRENVRVAESWGWRQPIIAYDSGSNGAEDYRSLTTELFTK